MVTIVSARNGFRIHRTHQLQLNQMQLKKRTNVNEPSEPNDLKVFVWEKYLICKNVKKKTFKKLSIRQAIVSNRKICTFFGNFQVMNNGWFPINHMCTLHAMKKDTNNLVIMPLV